MALICWKKNYVVNFCFGLIFPFSFCLKTKIISLLSAGKKNTNVGKMRIGRNSDLCAAGLQKPKNLHF